MTSDEKNAKILMNYPDPNVMKAGSELYASVERKRQTFLIIQESLAQIRMEVKYTVFDLEATRRERDSYKERLAKYEKP